MNKRNGVDIFMELPSEEPSSVVGIVLDPVPAHRNFKSLVTVHLCDQILN